MKESRLLISQIGYLRNKGRHRLYNMNAIIWNGLSSDMLMNRLDDKSKVVRIEK